MCIADSTCRKASAYALLHWDQDGREDSTLYMCYATALLLTDC